MSRESVERALLSAGQIEEENERLRDLLREAMNLMDRTIYNGINFHEAKNGLLARIREALGEEG